MIKHFYIGILIIITACNQTSTTSDNHSVTYTDSISKTNHVTSTKKIKLTNKTVKFLWRENQYDKELKDSLNIIVINQEYCRTITDPEKAALGFVATFIGNDCDWDGDSKDDRSNLKCKILTALDLGYQCSEKHLGFLRNWFKNDKESLIELTNCPTTPFTSTAQDTFDEITLTIKGDKIIVFFKANGMNFRERDTWNWTETDIFQLDNNNIKHVKHDQTKPKHEHLVTNE